MASSCGSKDRDTVETAQVTAQLFLVIVAALGKTRYDPVFERNQKIRISLSTRPSAERVRDTYPKFSFQRVIWNNRNQLSRVETIADENVYREFFEKLAKAAFLQAHEI